MSKKLLTVLMLAVAVLVSAPQAFANDEGQSCKADADCGHGEHCKDGHCHK